MASHEIITADLSEHKSQTLFMQEAANAYTVEHDGLEAGEHVLKSIRTTEVSLMERKEEITRPLMQGLASIRSLFKPLESGLADAKKTIKEKILAYQIEADEKSAKEAERVAKRVEKGTMKAETAAGKLETIEKGKVKTNTRTLTKVRVIDETLIPREYLIPNMPAITEAILRQNVEIAGVEKYEEKILVAK